MKVWIEWVYRTKKGFTSVLRSDTLSVAEALLLAEDIEKTGRVKELYFVDEHDSQWTLKELRKFEKEIETEPHDVEIYFDGGYERHEKRAGIGFVLYFKQNGKSWRKRINAAMDSISSNNEAEYASLEAAVTELLLMETHHQTITIYGDSQVVLKQMSGEWPAYEKELTKWADRIDQLLGSAGLTAHYMHIPRQQNKEAHRLATQALEGTMISAVSEV